MKIPKLGKPPNLERAIPGDGCQLVPIRGPCQLVDGFASLGVAQSGGVAFFAHIGGFLAGLLLILPAWFNDRRNPARFTGWR